jgi:predicted acylesterase/phospholipase RssA
VAVTGTSDKRIAICRGGGGIPGIERLVGIWRAMSEQGIHGTNLFGNSAGAIVSLLDAVGHDAEWAWALLSSLTDEDLRDEVPFWRPRYVIPSSGLLARLFGRWRVDHILRTGKMEAMLEKHAGFRYQIRKAFTVYASDFATGEGVELSILAADTSGYRLNSVGASWAISGVFPRRRLGGRDLTDGGTSNNAALPQNWADFDDVWLLIASGGRDARHEGGSGVSNMLRNAWLYGRDQTHDAIRALGLSVQQLQARGWDTRTMPVFEDGKHGRMVRVNALWPDFSDRGSLRLCPGLMDQTYRWARQALSELHQSIAREEGIPF